MTSRFTKTQATPGNVETKHSGQCNKHIPSDTQYDRKNSSRSLMISNTPVKITIRFLVMQKTRQYSKKISCDTK